MSHSHKEEIRSYLERAEEALTAARLLKDRTLHDSAASRAYYVFHAATAAMLAQGEVFKTHSSVLAAFRRVYVGTGRLT